MLWLFWPGHVFPREHLSMPEHIIGSGYISELARGDSKEWGIFCLWRDRLRRKIPDSIPSIT
jgi:hypothetical protein